MRTLLGLTGTALIGIGIVTLIAGWRVGLCAGVIMLGCVLVIDAVIK